MPEGIRSRPKLQVVPEGCWRGLGEGCLGTAEEQGFSIKCQDRWSSLTVSKHGEPLFPGYRDSESQDVHRGTVNIVPRSHGK